MLKLLGLMKHLEFPLRSTINSGSSMKIPLLVGFLKSKRRHRKCPA